MLKSPEYCRKNGMLNTAKLFANNVPHGNSRFNELSKYRNVAPAAAAKAIIKIIAAHQLT
jgi:hypothetical protein